MKRALPILTLLAGQALAVENSVPSAFTADRYEKMIEKSPFALATPVVAPAAPQASFAANWYLTAVGRDPQGQDFATVKAHDNSVHYSLTGRDAYIDPTSPANGVSIASVDWSDTFRKTTVILKKGTETAKVIFSQEEAMASAPAATAMRPGGPAGAGPLPPVTIRQGAGSVVQSPIQPRVALPRPSSPSVVAPPPQPVVQGQPPGAVVQPGGDTRRRVRNIAAPE